MNTALLGNLCILGSKGVVYALNGSSSILAEAVHSCADIANQYLLRVGNVQVRTTPTKPPQPVGKLVSKAFVD